MTAVSGDVLWRPDDARILDSELTRFAAWLRETGAAEDADTSDYARLWRWSTRDLDRFWRSVATYFGVEVGTRPNRSGKPCRMAFLLLGALPVPAPEAAEEEQLAGRQT